MKALTKAVADYTRGVTLAKDFEDDRKKDCAWLGVDFEGDDEEWEPPALPKAREVVINRHKPIKKTAKYTVGYGGTAYGAAQKGMAVAGGVGLKGALHLRLRARQHSPAARIGV
ncbi:MAG TPA: hypothetical protein VMD55_07430 [Terracidiphilus sp.]|nr:hypothetical protein [Terracidiphilus sp.]